MLNFRIKTLNIIKQDEERIQAPPPPELALPVSRLGRTSLYSVFSVGPVLLCAKSAASGVFHTAIFPMVDPSEL